MASANLDDRIRDAQDRLLSTMAPEQVPANVEPRVPISGPDFTPGVNGEPSRLTVRPRGVVGTDENAATGLPGGSAAAPAISGGNTLPEPTPTDTLPSQLNQKREQVLQQLRDEGFDGYTPDVRDTHSFTPDDNQRLAGAVTDISAGFNVSLARTLSLPRETVDRGLGLLGLDYMQHGGPQQQTIDALNRMGIPAYEVETLANKIGRGALPALATWAAMQLAAPSMALQQGQGTFGYLGREIGQWALKHPIVGLWLGQTSQAGGKIATDRYGEGFGTEFAGELAGGIAPGLAKSAAKLPLKLIPGSKPLLRATGKAIGSGINAISDALPTDLGNAIKKYNPLYQQKPAVASEGLINPNFDQNRLQAFAQDQIIGAQTYQDKAIENAINAIPRSGTAGQVQARTHDLLLSAEKISKRIVSGFWERVPLKTKIGVNDLRRDVRQLGNELRDVENQRPDTLMEKILEVTLPKRLPNGQMQTSLVSVQKLRDLQSQIGTAITEERARDAPREGMVRNMARLSDMIDENIARQLPNDTSIEQARQMSKRHNDLFSRGPINDILSKRRTGDFRINPSDNIDSLMQKTDGLAALKAVQEGVSTYPRIPTNKFRPGSYYRNPHAVTPAEKAQLDQLIKSAEDSIRTSFREAVDAKGPKGGVAYSVKNEEAIKALSKVSGELAQAAMNVANALAEKKTIDASALARFAQTSPDKAVKNLFAQRDPADVARRLMISFRGDEDALSGLQNQVLKEFIYEKGKTNPNLMQRMMEDPRIENLLQAVLSNDQWGRLKRIVDTGVRVGVEDEAGLKAFLRSPAKTSGRILGAYIGRKLNTGTIQTPGIISKAAGNYAERLFGATEPSDLLAQAVIDPHWEQILYSRIPTTTREIQTATKHYRRMFAAINSSFQQTLNKLSKNKEEE